MVEFAKHDIFGNIRLALLRTAAAYRILADSCIVFVLELILALYKTRFPCLHFFLQFERIDIVFITDIYTDYLDCHIGICCLDVFNIVGNVFLALFGFVWLQG